MSHRSKRVQTYGDLSVIEVKSKFEAEFRRFAIKRETLNGFSEFVNLVQCIHRLYAVPFDVFYKDPLHGDLLPINNTENCLHALNTAQPLLRLFLQRKGELTLANGVSEDRRKSFFGPLMNQTNSSAIPAPLRSRLNISTPQDFRRVSAIIDVDILPETVRRVRLCKHNSDKPLGFYIRDGTSVKVTPEGIEKVPGIFISRLVPGGLAESTGLLSVNDEVLEVNGIEVCGKSLDQVTDMMVANSHNLIITVRPVNQIPTRSSTLQHGNGINSRKVTMSESARHPNSSHNGIHSGIVEDGGGPIPDSDDEEDDEPLIAGGIVHV